MSAKQHPLLMRPELVRATLAGSKTVTRRLDLRWLKAAPGDLIWVKETWRTTAGLEGMSPVAIAKAAKAAGYGLPWMPVEYVADGHRDNWEPHFHRTPEEMKPGRTRVSIHMPKWAARLWLEVVSVREEHVQDITEEDARREGVDGNHGVFHDAIQSAIWNVRRRNFAVLWDAINGSKPGASWAENPRVVRIEFRRAERPEASR